MYERAGAEQAFHPIHASYTTSRLKDLARQAQIYIRPLQKDIRSGLFQVRQSTSCPQANCILASNNYFNGFFRFKYFLNVFKNE